MLIRELSACVVKWTISWIHCDCSSCISLHYGSADVNCSVFQLTKLIRICLNSWFYLHSMLWACMARFAKNGFLVIWSHYFHLFPDIWKLCNFMCFFVLSGPIILLHYFSTLGFVNADKIFFGKTSSFMFEKLKVVHDQVKHFRSFDHSWWVPQSISFFHKAICILFHKSFGPESKTGLRYLLLLADLNYLM